MQLNLIVKMAFEGALFTWFIQKLIIQKKQLSEPPSIPISSVNRLSTAKKHIHLLFAFILKN